MFAILLPVAAGLCISCSRSDSSGPDDRRNTSAQILAVVGDEQITVTDFQVEWTRRQANGHVTRKQQENVLEDMIRAKAALAKARAAGFDRDPATLAATERFIVGRYTEAEFARRFAKEPSVDDQEILNFYRANPEQFREPAAARAGIIFLKINPKAAADKRVALRAKAEAIRSKAQATDNATFSSLAQQHSEDQSTRYTGGDTGWLNEGGAVQDERAVIQVVFSLKEAGEVAPLVATDNGFYIVRLMERRTAKLRPMAEVQAAISYRLLQQKRQQREQQFFEELKQGLDIQINHALLPSDLPATSSEAAPPTLPGS